MLVLPQILSEVRLVHVLEDEAHRMLGGGVDTDERHEALVPEATAGQCLLAKPLPINFLVSRIRPTGYQVPLPCGSVDNPKMGGNGNI